MRYIFTSLLLSVVIYFSSCTSSDSSGPAPVTYDSVSKGGNFSLSFTNDSFVTENFLFNDYTSNGIAVITLHATVAYNHTDSLWHLSLQSIDGKMKRISVNFSGIGTAALGNFSNTVNGSTMIDYTNGENITYAISLGSVVNITQATYPIQGTFTFNLNRNYFTTQATGSFSIYY